MKLVDARSIYYERTTKASDIVRQLAFAAIAIIWLFRAEDTSTAPIPHQLILPGLLVIAALAADLLQYVIAGLLWGHFSRKKEKDGVGVDGEFEAPARINWPALAFYYMKIVLVLIAYFNLGRFAIGRLV